MMDISEVARFVAALIFIVGLIGLCAFVAKRFNLVPGAMGMSGKDKRLALIEVKALDTKHRLILIRRDNREHLVLVGGEAPVVVESGIEVSDAQIAAEKLAAAPSPIQMQQLMQTVPAPVRKIIDYIKERRA